MPGFAVHHGFSIYAVSVFVAADQTLSDRIADANDMLRVQPLKLKLAAEVEQNVYSDEVLDEGMGC